MNFNNQPAGPNLSQVWDQPNFMDVAKAYGAFPQGDGIWHKAANQEPATNVVGEVAKDVAGAALGWSSGGLLAASNLVGEGLKFVSNTISQHNDMTKWQTEQDQAHALGLVNPAQLYQPRSIMSGGRITSVPYTLGPSGFGR